MTIDWAAELLRLLVVLLFLFMLLAPGEWKIQDRLEALEKKVAANQHTFVNNFAYDL